MGLYNSETYISDIDIAMEGCKDVLNYLSNSSILITGATGLVCSPIADIIFRANNELGTDIELLLAGRSEERMEERFKGQRYTFVPYNANKKNEFNFHADYVIHGASNSSPTEIMAHGIETMVDNFSGIYELLSYAFENGVRNTLYISSSEVYGIKGTIAPFLENEYGEVDILSPRSAYASAKRAAETLCVCFSNEKGIKTTIVRPGHIYGPTAKKSDSHVCSLFSFSAAAGRDIVMKSAGEQIRSWCYCLDSATAILTVLVKGVTCNAYNISDPKSIFSIRDMAHYLADEAGVKLMVDIPDEIEKSAFNPMNNSSLNGDKLLGIGWRGRFGARLGLEHTIKILKEANNNHEERIGE